MDGKLKVGGHESVEVRVVGLGQASGAAAPGRTRCAGQTPRAHLDPHLRLI